MVKLWVADMDKSKFTAMDNIENFASISTMYLEDIPLDAFPDITIVLRPRTPVSDFFMAGPLFIVSEQLKEFLDANRVQAEYFKVNVRFRNTKVLYKNRDYFFLHLLDHVDCIDIEKSESTKEYYRNGSHRYSVSSLVIDEKKTQGHQLFRISGITQVVDCASDDLVRNVEATEFTGIKFVTPDRLHNWMFM